METRIVESAPRGRTVVATKNYLPGALVLEEEPIMLVPKEYVKRYEALSKFQPDLVPFVASYWWFTKRLSRDDKKKVLSMCGPTNTSTEGINAFRYFAERTNLCCLDDPTASGRLTPEEVEIFVKLACIMKVNMVGLEKDKILYFQLSQFAHSCAANCHYEYEHLQTTVRLRTTRAIQAGEEMTYSYLSKRDLQPIHVRRQAYLGTKEFTCHCPRCDDPGDDTRQFDCCDPACSGVMRVCHPRTKADMIVVHRSQYPDGRVEESGPRYSGVKYVEPHLLPCTVCHRPAPVAYQTKMFALEEKMQAVGDSFTEREDKLFDKADIRGYERLHQEIKSLQAFHKLPRFHALAVPIWRVLMKIHRFNFLVAFQKGRLDCKKTLERYRATVQRSAADYLAAQEAVMPHAHRTTADALFWVCNYTMVSWRNIFPLAPLMFPPAEAKVIVQKALRMFLVLNGRDKRTKPPVDLLDPELFRTLEDLPSLGTRELCAFCEESPKRAALKRSRCGTCRAVMYCSAGCQKAHWKLHKKTCEPRAIAEDARAEV